MKIIYIVDLHGQDWLLNNIIPELIKENPDLLLIGGDYCSDPETLMRLGMNVLLISGEQDDIYLTKKAKSLNIFLDGRVTQYKSTILAGIGGIEPHQNIRRIISKYMGSIDILITHYPPKNCLDTVMNTLKGGLIEINALISSMKPKIILTGHFHNNSGIMQCERGLAVNPGPLYRGYYAVVETAPFSVVIKSIHLTSKTSPPHKSRITGDSITSSSM